MPANPALAPYVRLQTRIYHPNVNDAGFIGLPILYRGWTSSHRVAGVLEAIVGLLEDPRPDGLTVGDLAQEYRVDRAEYSRKAIEWTQRYAR